MQLFFVKPMPFYHQKKLINLWYLLFFDSIRFVLCVSKKVYFTFLNFFCFCCLFCGLFCCLFDRCRCLEKEWCMIHQQKWCISKLNLPNKVWCRLNWSVTSTTCWQLSIVSHLVGVTAVWLMICCTIWIVWQFSLPLVVWWALKWVFKIWFYRIFSMFLIKTKNLFFPKKKKNNCHCFKTLFVFWKQINIFLNRFIHKCGVKM